MKPTLEHLKTLLGDVYDLRKAAEILEWDQQTYMPPGGVETRARQLATLQRIAHEKFISEKVGRVLEDLRPLAEAEDDDSDACRLVRLTRREYDKACKLPPDLVAQLAQKSAQAYSVWEQAREEKDFSRFAPILEELIDLTQRKAENLGYRDHIYDSLLDSYEPEMKTDDVVKIFRQLKHALIPLIQNIAREHDAVKNTAFQGNFYTKKQWEFGMDVLHKMGYDFQRGRQDASTHPFTIAFSPDDVRITTRLNPNMFTMALFGSIHEGGHALYEQGIGRNLMRTPLCDGASMAVHESQSRFWENVIGRSREFWTYFFPHLQSLFPDELQGVTVEQAYRSVNVVRPDYIRVEADEVTYNLHIFLRFELEIALMAREIEVKDLPELWNHKMRKYLGLTPPDDALGVLQDIHWATGAFGYFPTYTLGNILSLQFCQAMRSDLPEFDAHIENGDFLPILQWLREHIHQHGAKFPPAELVRKVTGEPINPQPYIDYLQHKYGELYGTASV